MRYAAPMVLTLVPAVAFAQSIARALGYLDIFIGLFLAVSIVMFVGAFIVYLVRYGTAHREEMFEYMHWSIAILFVISVLLALIHFFQSHTSAVIYLVGIIAFLLITVFIIHIAAKKPEKAEHK